MHIQGKTAFAGVVNIGRQVPRSTLSRACSASDDEAAAPRSGS